MNTALNSGESNINNRIVSFGRQIFESIGREQPSAFNKNYWSGRMMEWSMKLPEFKVNLFRLVDVLPSLRSNRSLADHIREYLGGRSNGLPGIMRWGAKARGGTPLGTINAVLAKKMVHQMAGQFIAGYDAKSAIAKLKSIRQSGMNFTVDLLGEFALSESECTDYLNRYLEALETLGDKTSEWPKLSGFESHPGETSPVCISVKLTALYSQCNPLNFDGSIDALAEKLSVIARKAKQLNAILYVDAEDTGNNPLIYGAFKKVFGSPEFCDFPYPGIVVQAYAHEARAMINDLLDFARKRGGPIAIRLVKGAYWDFETIVSAQNNWPSPLFSKKESSDANYEALSRLLLDNISHVMPAFGSHNVRSLAHACCYAESIGITRTQFELQMLYGMADPIARSFVKEGYLVRLYVPLGQMLPGMGYLVRRLLENTSNESFLRHTFFEAEKVDELLKEPQFLD